MDMMHDYITSFLTALDSKEPYINIKGSLGGNTLVHNINSRIVVFINSSRRFLGETKSPEHIPQEPISVFSSYIRNKLCFHGTQRIDWLSFRSVNNLTYIKHKRKSSNGSSLGRLISVWIFHRKHQLSLINVLLGFRYIFIPYNLMALWYWKIRSWYYSFVPNPPVSGNMEIYILSFFRKL